jgi:hypothetical protein
MSKQKKNAAMSGDEAKLAAKLLGRQISEEKQRVLLCVTLLACALPMVLGARLWNDIPAIVHTGLIGTDGTDDSIPRVMVAYGLPGLMCLLDLIAHFMLRFNQKRQTIPPRASRLIGRWGFPIISVVLCSGMILESTGTNLSLPFVTPCVLGLVLMLLGSHVWDCKEDAKIALRTADTKDNPILFKAVNRFAGWVWMLVGLAVIAGVMLTSSSTIITAALIIVALAAPFIYAHVQGDRRLD